jgi:hypothetical protein
MQTGLSFFWLMLLGIGMGLQQVNNQFQNEYYGYSLKLAL